MTAQDPPNPSTSASTSTSTSTSTTATADYDHFLQLLKPMADGGSMASLYNALEQAKATQHHAHLLTESLASLHASKAASIAEHARLRHDLANARWSTCICDFAEEMRVFQLDSSVDVEPRNIKELFLAAARCRVEMEDFDGLVQGLISEDGDGDDDGERWLCLRMLGRMKGRGNIVVGRGAEGAASDADANANTGTGTGTGTGTSAVRGRTEPETGPEIGTEGESLLYLCSPDECAGKKCVLVRYSTENSALVLRWKDT